MAASILTALAGCGSVSHLDNQAAPLPWPPEDGLARAASDDSVTLLGRQYSQVGGSTLIETHQLKIGPSGGNLSWALYSLQGFGASVQLAAILPDFTQVNSGVGDTTRLNFGLANYELGRWEWFDIAPGDPPLSISNPDDYVSPLGSVHVAAVLSGAGYARLRELRIDRSGPGAVVPVPANLSATAVPGSVLLEWDPIQFAQGYRVFRASNGDFSDEVQIGPGLLSDPEYTDTNVVKFEQYWYRVRAVRNDQDSAPSLPAAVTAADTTLNAPLKPTSTTQVGAITLDWNDVPGATSYRVERATRPDFTPLQSFVTSDSNYTDSSVINGTMYYYRIVARGIEDSPPSPYEDVYAPRVSLLAPTNFRVLTEQSSGDYVTFAWDYEGEPQGGFRIWLHAEPDFYFNGQEIPVGPAPGNQRTFRRHDLPSGASYYARIAARATGNDYGRMSKAIHFDVGTYWTWGDLETLGAGSELFEVISDGTDLSVVYMAGSAVRLSRRDNGTWDHGIVTGLNSSYGVYIDVAAGGGKHIVGALHVPSDDMWVSVGEFTGTWDWTPTRIHGDGNTGTDREASGHFNRVTADDDEFAATHMFFGAPHQVVLHTRPVAGGTWTDETIRTTDIPFLESSMTRRDNELHMMDYDVGVDNLLYGSTTNTFAWDRVNPVDGDSAGSQIKLLPFGTELLTTGYSGIDEIMFAYRGIDGNFVQETVVQGLGTLTRGNLAVDGDRALITFVRPTNPPRMFYAERTAEGWEPSTLDVPNNDVALKVVGHAGDFYVIYRTTGGDLVCAKGIPPS